MHLFFENEKHLLPVLVLLTEPEFPMRVVSPFGVEFSLTFRAATRKAAIQPELRVVRHALGAFSPVFRRSRHVVA